MLAFCTKTRLFSHHAPGDNHPSIIHFSSTPLFKLEKNCEQYAHLLKKKDVDYAEPIINYFIGSAGHEVYLGGDAVKNFYFYHKKKYKFLNLLAVRPSREDADKCAGIMNNIISSNDGAFSMRLKYRVRKNRSEGYFKDVALARYVIEPRLEGPEKILYPFRSSSVEIDITTEKIFSEGLMQNP